MSEQCIACSAFVTEVTQQETSVSHVDGRQCKPDAPRVKPRPQRAFYTSIGDIVVVHEKATA